MADRVASTLIFIVVLLIVIWLAMVSVTSCTTPHKCQPGQHWDRGEVRFVPIVAGKTLMMIPTYPNGHCEARRD